MKIRKTIERIPGGMMVVPLLLGALINTIDQAHLPAVGAAMEWLGVPPTPAGHYEMLQIGTFTTALFKTGALALIGLFLVCAGAQMDFRVGRRSLKKGLIITASKWLIAAGFGYALGAFTDPFNGFLGLSLVAIIGAMSNGNGGMYVALTGQYGSRSDVGAISVISLNDGPFLTLLALGMLGEKFPLAAFLSVLLPMLIGFTLGQLDPDMRAFLAPGERLLIPFFAFALGTTMNLATFLSPDVLAGGIFLGAATVLLTGPLTALVLRLFGERSTIAAIAEASTAGNAIQTPQLVAAAAMAAGGTLGAERAADYARIVPIATGQISISTMVTALLCPMAVILWSRFQSRRGIDARAEPGAESSSPATSPAGIH